MRTEHDRLHPFAFDINSMNDEDDQLPEVLFTENETNLEKLCNKKNVSPYVKDAFHEYLINDKKAAINPTPRGTKVALHYKLNMEAQSSRTLYLRLYQFSDNGTIPQKMIQEEMGKVFDQRKVEADLFYESLYTSQMTVDEKNIVRQAYAGLLHTKQFYNYIVRDWLDGKGKDFMPSFSDKRKETIINTEWSHM